MNRQEISEKFDVDIKLLEDFDNVRYSIKNDLIRQGQKHPELLFLQIGANKFDEVKPKFLNAVDCDYDNCNDDYLYWLEPVKKE